MRAKKATKGIQSVLGLYEKDYAKKRAACYHQQVEREREIYAKVVPIEFLSRCSSSSLRCKKKESERFQCVF